MTNNHIPLFDKKRYKMVKEFLLECNPKNLRIADIGSGKYPITNGIPSKKTTTIDINPDNNPDIVHDITKGLPFPSNSFDIVVACELLEHLINPKNFLLEANRVLSPNGCLVVSSPNICSLRYRLSFLFGKIPAHASKGCINGHVRDFNLNELICLLNESGFQAKETRTDGIWLNNPITPRIPSPVTLGDSLIIKCVKKDDTNGK